MPRKTWNRSGSPSRERIQLVGSWGGGEESSGFCKRDVATAASVASPHGTVETEEVELERLLYDSDASVDCKCVEDVGNFASL